MTTPRALLATIACLITLTGARGADSPSDEQAIRALYERFSTAVEKKDLLSKP